MKQVTTTGSQNFSLRVLIVYTAAPDRGSEPGAGWGFLGASAKLSRHLGDNLLVILKQEDREVCEVQLRKEGKFDNLHFSAVGTLGGTLGRLAGGRIGYLIWRLSVIKKIRNISKEVSITSIHQATWGTALLPPAVPRNMREKLIWGPVAVPQLISPLAKTIIQPLIKSVAKMNARGVRLLIANNDFTKSVFGARGDRTVVLEPHIFAEKRRIRVSKVRKQICVVGLLVKRKRVDLAIRLLEHSRLGDFNLKIVGDGPQRSKLEKLVSELGLDNRISITGWLTHDEALNIIAESVLLIHPSEREGAGFVVGEAAAMGTRAISFQDSGAATVIRFSENGGEVVMRDENAIENLAETVLRLTTAQLRTVPSNRWSSRRFKYLLNSWWHFEPAEHPVQP